MVSEYRILEGGRVTTRRQRTAEELKCAFIGAGFLLALVLMWWVVG